MDQRSLGKSAENSQTASCRVYDGMRDRYYFYVAFLIAVLHLVAEGPLLQNGGTLVLHSVGYLAPENRPQSN